MDWDDLRYFLAVYRAGSTSGAARALRGNSIMAVLNAAIVVIDFVGTEIEADRAFLMGETVLSA